LSGIGEDSAGAVLFEASGGGVGLDSVLFTKTDSSAAAKGVSGGVGWISAWPSRREGSARSEGELLGGGDGAGDGEVSGLMTRSAIVTDD
jgi:hypothetical protein